MSSPYNMYNYQQYQQPNQQFQPDNQVPSSLGMTGGQPHQQQNQHQNQQLQQQQQQQQQHQQPMNYDQPIQNFPFQPFQRPFDYNSENFSKEQPLQPPILYPPHIPIPIDQHLPQPFHSQQFQSSEINHPPPHLPNIGYPDYPNNQPYQNPPYQIYNQPIINNSKSEVKSPQEGSSSQQSFPHYPPPPPPPPPPHQHQHHHFPPHHHQVPYSMGSTMLATPVAPPVAPPMVLPSTMHKGFKPQFEQFDNRLILDKNSINHFKPIQTKKNSRPRINKLNKNEQLLSKVSSDIRRSSIQKNKKIEYFEKSLDELFQHFQKVMNIEKPIRNGNLEMGIDYQLKVKNDLESKLLDLFIHRLSKSIDIFLPDEIFKRIIPELSLYDETGMILDSIFCLSSLIFQRSAPDKIDPSIPVKYYHQSIRSIRYYLSIPGIEDNDKGIFSRCLLSTIILCVYELFFVAVDSTYIKGASSILSTILSKNKNESILKNSPFHQTCFWAMFFSDLILSLKYDLPSMYSSDKFWKPLDPEYFEKYNRPSHVEIEKYQLEEEETKEKEGLSEEEMAKLNYDKYISDLTLNKEDTIWWLYKSLLNYSSINEFNNQVEVITKQDFENNTPFKEWLKLKSKLDEFESYMPLNLKPTIYKPSSNTRVFPIIFFKDEMTAVLVLNYKLSKIALYEALISKPNQNDDLVKNQIANYPPDYRQKIAKDIIGILMTYDSNINVWSVNVHTLRQLAKYVGKDPETHKGWQNLVERVIRSIHLRFEVHQ